MNVPNAICYARTALALGTLGLLWLPDDTVRWTAVVLTGIVIWGDALDGYFARKLDQATKFGAMLDIVCDRVVEMAYWIAFAALQWIPVWVPLVFLVRGNFVDAVRSVASEKGFTAFGDKTMMETGLGKFLVASNFMRFGYAVAKAAAFCLVIAAHTELGATTVLPAVAISLVYITCIVCIIRGIPVLIEGRRLL